MTKNQSGDRGGALYNQGALTVEASDSETSLFSGNTASGAANSIYSTGSIDFIAGTDGVIDLRDPVLAGVNGSDLTFTKTGDGTLKLGGVNQFHADDSNTAAWSFEAGTLHLYGAGEVANATRDDANAMVEDGSIRMTNANATFAFGNGTDAVTLIVGGDNAIQVDGGVTLNDNAVILAGREDTSLAFSPTADTTVNGTVGLTLTDDQSMALSGTFVGDTMTKDGEGNLSLTLADTFAGLDAFSFTGGGTLSSAEDQAFQSITTDAASTVDLSGQTLTAETGVLAGAVRAENLVKNGSGQLSVTGQTTLTGGLTVNDGDLHVHIQNNQPTITADTVAFLNGSSLHVTGYSAGATSSVSVITANNAITNLPTGPTADDMPVLSYDFLSMGVTTNEDNTAIVIDSVLNWYNTDQNPSDVYHEAHGTFTLNDENFTMGTQLDNRTEASFRGLDDWDGMCLTKKGNGTLTLTAQNTYSGTTTIEEGAIVGTCDQALGSSSLTVNAGASYIMAYDGTHTNVVDGAGTLEHQSGTIYMDDVLTGFTGDLQVTGGTLILGKDAASTADASSLALVNIGADGRLHGNGSTGDLTVSGVVAPGHSIGTITVNGDLTFAPGSVYEVEVDPGDTTAADLLDVTGTADLANATVRHVGMGGENDYSPTGRWLILTAADGLGGTTFAADVDSPFVFLDQTLEYENDQDVYLAITRNARALGAFAYTPNQNAVANALDSLSGGSLANAILAVPAGTDVADLYDQLSGEMHASLRSLLRQYDAIFGRTLLGRSLVPNLRCDEFPVWADFGGSNLWKKGDRGVAKAKLNTVNATVGLERRLAGGWLVGGAFRYGHADFKVDDRNSKADLNSYSFGLYAGKAVPFASGALRWSAGLAYTYHDVDSDRTVTVPSMRQTLSGDYHAQSLQLVSDLGYQFALSPAAMIEPFVRLGWHSLWTGSFTETGGYAALQTDRRHKGVFTHTLGVRAAYAVSERVAVQAGAGWVHAYGSKASDSHFRFVQGGDRFVVNGVTITRDAAEVNASVGFTINERAMVGLSYDGYFGSKTRNHGGRIFAQYSF